MKPCDLRNAGKMGSDENKPEGNIATPPKPPAPEVASEK
jgi:hypothetical protein